MMTSSAVIISVRVVMRKPSTVEKRDGAGGDDDHLNRMRAVAPAQRRKCPAFTRPQKQQQRRKMMVRPATIFGMKPEPGIDNCPVGRSPLNAMISTPEGYEGGAGDMVGHGSSSLHAADRVDGVFLALAVGRPEFGEFRLIHIGQILAEIIERI